MAYSMKSLGRFLCILIMGASIASVSSTPVNAQGARRIDVFSSRSLSDAIKILERELDCVITYEDPLWEYPLVVNAMFEGGPVVPKRGRLTLLYNLGDPATVIQELLNQYHKQTDTARYELIVGPDGIYNVVPVKHRSKTGQLVESRSILDDNITLSMQEVPYSALMDEILDKLSQRLALARHFRQLPRKVSVSWNNRNARSCINQIFYETNKYETEMGYMEKYSRSIRRDPKPVYPAFLNVHRVSSTSSGTGPWHMKITATRPLAEALKILEEIFGVTITYEDTLFLFRFDLMMNRAGEPQMPRGGMIDFSYAPNDSAEQVIRYCLAAYHDHTANTGIFTMEKDGSVFHVFPMESKDEQDILVPYDSVLATAISVSEQDKTPLDILRAICAKAVESSGTKINVGEFPQDRFSAPLSSFSTDNKPARVALTEFVKTVHRKLSWQLIYDPKSEEYILNIHSIASE